MRSASAFAFALASSCFCLVSFSCLAFLEGLHLGKGFLREMTFPSGFGTREMCQDLRSLGELIFSFLFSFLIVLENLLNRII